MSRFKPVVFLLIVLPTIAGSCQNEPSEYLFDHWKISYDESNQDTLIFRPSDYDMAPSRMRVEYEFFEDGNLKYYTLGPADKPKVIKGSWEVDGGKLILRINELNAFLWELISISDDKLVVIEQKRR